MSKKAERIFPIELLRIIACCMVITIHTLLPVKMDTGLYDSSRVLISCLIGDAVGIFWFIGGCFLFNPNLNYKKTILKTLKRIVIPMAIITLITFYFGRFFAGSSLLESIMHTKAEYFTAFKTLLKWSNPADGAGHLWYLYIYCLIIIALPVLNSFVCYLDTHPSAQKWFCLITLLLFMLNDLCHNGTFSFAHYGINGTVPASIEIIWGHIRYKNRDKLRFKFSPFVWLLLFGLVIVVRWRLQMILYVHSGSNHFLFWYTSFGLICSSCLLLFVLHTFRPSAENWIKRAICFIGKKTYPIYLMHMCIYHLLQRFGVEKKLYQLTVENHSGVLGELLFTAGITLAVFIVGFIIAFILDFIMGKTRLIRIHNKKKPESL